MPLREEMGVRRPNHPLTWLSRRFAAFDLAYLGTSEFRAGIRG